MDTFDASSDSAAQAFITRWRGITASELSTAQSFVIDLCALLDVDRPHPTPAQDYMFERPVTFRHGDGSTSAGRVDCYRLGSFCLESKKLKAAGHTKGFDDGMLRARSQAENYARALPATEGRPPFVLVVDVGNLIEVYAEFSQSGATYTPFPDPRSHRIRLDDLAKGDIRARLRQIWLDPHSLNPARISARVTRQVAELLARLAKSIEANPVDEFNPSVALNHTACVAPEKVASFLTRCLFSMFAEDVGLLPKEAFVGLLKAHRADPPTLRLMLQSLWSDMDRGGFSPALAVRVLHFNGKLFKEPMADGYSLLLNAEQIGLLIEAAQANWREVEPAIFGTLLERALDPTERHALGAHYTPRAYVERLVLPTVVEPLRAEWANAQAAALVLAHEASDLEATPPLAKGGVDAASFDRQQLKADQQASQRHDAAVRAKWREARAQVKAFHHRLCSVRVLDPACGSANFLYVTLEHLKRLEGEVLNQMAALGDAQESIADGFETVTLQQLQGIELNPRAAALAELVLWIGWLQWHIRTQCNAAVAEPVVHDYRNIDCRDAVLAWNAQEPAFDAAGQLLSRWDGVTFKLHPVTGEKVPDEAAQVPQWRYLGARQAMWPVAEFVVGNPPFIGKLKMREALGDGYVEALRAAWTEVPDSADFVMHWWARAAALVAAGQVERMGLITTNSLTMIFNRRVVQSALDGALRLSDGAPPVNFLAAKAARCELAFAIPDHPWVDSADGAAVRIAMTVVQRAAVAKVGSHSEFAQENAGSDPTFVDSSGGRLLTVTDEQPGPAGEVTVTLAERRGQIHADLTAGANVQSAQALAANLKLASAGVIPHGTGMQLTLAQAATLESDAPIKPYRNGRDLTDLSRDMLVIDCYGLSADQVRERFPKLYQWLLDHVKPEREVNRDKDLREKWWLHRRNNDDMRRALAGLPRYIATVMTAKHRVFQFLDASVLPDQVLVAIGLSDAFHLGVLSSTVHGSWALATGGTLEDRPRYSKSTCFDTYPFPDEDTGLTPVLRQKIADLAEQIDLHRKRVLDSTRRPAKLGSEPDFVGDRGPRPDACPESGSDPDFAASPLALSQAISTASSVAPAAGTQTQLSTSSNAESVAPQCPSTSQTPNLQTASKHAKDLTLTGLYNVMQALREGRTLSAKEKQIHTSGQAGVLKSLHDELDAAVLAAYGWSDLADPMRYGTTAPAKTAGPSTPAATEARAGDTRDELLTRLVSLNQLRAADEAQGRVRWLRPKFQNPLAETERPAQVQQTLATGADTAAQATPAATTQSWPAALPEQVKAVAQLLSGSPVALTLADIAACFGGAPTVKKSLPILLQTLEALGRAQRLEVDSIALWRA
ncbi:MAG: class I SAM-dependent DNA methyltransferase [Rhodoferax sp.]|nr:class I SAM-dependent DNA methyltransferase [Rhodoferax sp.]